MPNDGIQAWRSTNWKSADAGLKRAHKQQRLGEDQHRHDERDAADRRSFSSSSRRTSSSSEPTIGSATSEVRIGNGHHAPQVVPEDQHDAEKQRHRVGADRSGLQPAQDSADPADRLAHAVDRAVDEPARRRPSRARLRTDPDRLDDGGVVDLVHVVLVLEQRPQAGEPFGDADRPRAVLQEEEHRDPDAGQADER